MTYVHFIAIKEKSQFATPFKCYTEYDKYICYFGGTLHVMNTCVRLKWKQLLQRRGKGV